MLRSLMPSFLLLLLPFLALALPPELQIGPSKLQGLQTVGPQQGLERLDRGVVAVRQADGKVFVSWRLLLEDPSTVSFNVYRLTEGQTPVKLNEAPIDKVTWLIDSVNVPTSATTYCVCEGAFQPSAGTCFKLKSANQTSPAANQTFR